MSRKIIIIGAGINGLVAANYLQRNGYEVSIIEAKAKVGGACTSETVTLAGKDYRYASGASVLGLMQRFIYEETGLSKKLKTFVPGYFSIALEYPPPPNVQSINVPPC